MKVGMVGLDNSHCPIFAAMLNDHEHPYRVPDAQVVGAYRGGTDQFSLSRNRIDRITQNVTQSYDVELCDSIEELAREVDALFLESCDGRQHLEQFRKMAIGKPVYIDKPFTTSTADATEIIRLAKETGTPIMSSSSMRYAAGIAGLVTQDERVTCCEVFGHAPVLDDYPGLFWYGVHSAEVLFSFMGVGCKQVRCFPYKEVDVVIGEWDDGRVGIVTGTRFEDGEYGCVIHTDKGPRCGVALHTPPTFYFLLQKVIEFFRTGISPIRVEETFSIMAFLEAANRSKEQGGVAIPTESL